MEKGPQIQIELLGRFRVLRAGIPIVVRSRNARALLTYLALHPGQAIPRSRLAGLLWEDEDEPVARHNLRQTLSDLRTILASYLKIDARKETLLLDGSSFRCDVTEFLGLCNSPTAGNIEAAASLYLGDLTTDFEVRSSSFEEWAAAERRRLHTRALEIFDACIRTLDQTSRKQEALLVCERLFALDPLRERTHQLLIGLELAVNGRSSALTRARALANELREQLGVEPEQPTQQIIDALSASPPAARAPATDAPEHKRRHLFRYMPMFAVASCLLIGVSIGFAGSYLLQNEEDSQQTTDLSHQRGYSVAVLPFTVRDAAPSLQRRLTQLQRDITDTLSHMPRFLTISHQTMQSYRNSLRDARDIGKELNVDYLISGDAYVENDATMIRVRLIDTATGAQLWSRRFTHQLSEKNDVLEEIATSFSHHFRMNVVISDGLKQERLDRKNPTFDDLIQRGFSSFFRSMNEPGKRVEALGFFEKALSVKPKSVTARVAVAQILMLDVYDMRSSNHAEELARADALLASALQDAPESSPALYTTGAVRKLQRRYLESIPYFEQALKINPSNVNAHVHLGQALIFVGRAEETEPYIEKAFRLGPFNQGTPYWHIFAGQADLHLDRYDRAISRFRKAIELNPDVAPAHFFLVAAYYLSGDKESAITAAAEMKRRFPKFNTRMIGDKGYFHPVFTPQRDLQIKAIDAAIALMESQTLNTH